MGFQQPNNQNEVFINALLCVILITLFTVFFLTLPNNISFGLFLIVGFWSIDAFLKKIFAYKNITAFADLSFTALVFAGGQAINLVTNKLSSVNTKQLFVILFTGLVLFITWIGNIGVCRGLENGQNSNSPLRRFLIWIISLIFAAFSVFGALYLHSLDI